LPCSDDDDDDGNSNNNGNNNNQTDKIKQNRILKIEKKANHVVMNY